MKIPHKKSPHKIVTISMGVANMIPGRGSEPNVLIKLADEALYKAKAEGRNRVVVAPEAVSFNDVDA